MGFFKRIFKPVQKIVSKAVNAVSRVVNSVASEVVSWFIDIPDLPDFDNQQRGFLVNKQSNVANIPVVYGTRRIGGTVVFMQSGGSTNRYLYMAIVLCEGEVDSIGDVFIDDLISTNSKYSGKVSIAKYVGTDSQTADNMLVSNTSWTTNHRLRGLAYLRVRLQYDRDTFTSIPTITANVNGKKVYDPRDGTTSFSKNTALCLRDYLTNSRYGKGLASAQIDDTAFSDAADDCDTLVSEYSGQATDTPLFECNCILDTSQTLFNNVNILLRGMRGMLPYEEGKYRVLVEKDESSTFAFNTSNMIGGLGITSVGKDSRYNRVEARFINPSANWQPDSIIWPPSGSTDESTFLTEDANIILETSIDLPTVTNKYTARDIARIVCLASRESKLTVNIEATFDAIKCTVGDIVTITHPTPSWTNKEFRVLSVAIVNEGTIRLTLQEHVASIYPWDSGDEVEAVEDPTFPDPFTVAAPTSLTASAQASVANDGTVISSILASWTAADDDFVEQYEVQYRKGTDNFQSVLTPDIQFIVPNTIKDQNYDVKVRSINSFGVRSSFVEVTGITAIGDSTAPSAPTGLTAVGGLGNITLDWTNPSDSDLFVTQIWENSVDNSATATNIAVTGSDSFVRGGLAPDVTRYYWIKAVDTSGNISGFNDTGGTTATTDIPAIKDRLIGRIETVSSLTTGLGTADEGKIEFLTTDSTLYKWTGTAWTSTFNLEDETGKILAQQIDVATLSAITADIGTVTAGTIKSTDDKFKILLSDKRIEVYDASNNLRVQLGYFGT